MGYLMTILLSGVVALFATIGAYNYIPLSFIETFGPETEQLGATITTIAATDTIKDSRAVINTNFANLNSDKIENSTSSVAAITTLSNLVTVGTLTSGSLGSGFTTVALTRGGTGSTTLCTNRVLAGNGTTNIQCVAPGTSGQFLQSNGAGSLPTFETSSIDQAANYTWTGNHIFTRSTTTNATTTSLQVSGLASTSQAIIGALGVGVSTSTQRNVQVAGDVQISGALSVAGSHDLPKGIYSASSVEVTSVDRFAMWSSTSTTNANISVPIPVAGRITNLYARVSAPNGNASGEAVAVYINGAVSSSTPLCKFTNGNGTKTCSDTTLSVNVVAGDYISFFFDTGDTGSASETAFFHASVQLR